MTNVEVAFIIAGGILVIAGILNAVMCVVTAHAVFSKVEKFTARPSFGFIILSWMWPAIIGGVLIFFGLT